MNKTELIAAIAEESGCSKKDVEKMLAAFMNTVTATVAKGEKVSLVGFGNFERATRAERQGKNPKTGESITIPQSYAMKFKAGKGVKDALNA